MMTDLELSKLKVVFMDIGGVLLSNGWGHESRQKAAEVFGFDYEAMNILHHFIYNVFEIGSISLDDYLDTVVFNVPRNFSKEDFKTFMYDQSTALPEMIPWMICWKKETQLPVFAISNESRELNDYRIEKFKLDQIFDGFFSSCYVGIRKPDPRIFHKAMEIVQAAPKQCIYFDDRLMLVAAAKKQGMHAILHENFEDTKQILDKLNTRL